MTTLAMGAGMLPMALKIGADADFRAPMAIPANSKRGPHDHQDPHP
jgi:hypothetical protein